CAGFSTIHPAGSLKKTSRRRRTRNADRHRTLFVVYRFIALLLLIPLLVLWMNPVHGQPPSGQVVAAPPLTGQALVERALANELNAAQDASHPMRYQLRKTSPRVTTTKEILETRDGEVARLIAINDKPLSAADEGNEE